MAPFRLSEEAERALLAVVEPACVADLKAMVARHRHFREVYAPANKRERAGFDNIRDDLRLIAERAGQLVDDIDTMSRRKVSRGVLDIDRLPPLGELAIGVTVRNTWADLMRLREAAARVAEITPAAGPIPSRAARGPGRPRTSEERRDLARDAAVVLRAHGVSLTKGRNGDLAKALRVVLAAVEGRAPTDMMQLLLAVCDEAKELPIQECRDYVRDLIRSARPSSNSSKPVQVQ